MLNQRSISFSVMTVFIPAFLISVFLPAIVNAQSQLPKCPSDPEKRWTNCHGIVTTPKGQKYDGEFQNDQYNGFGTLIIPGGEKYVGEFKDNKRNGKGVYTFPDGQKYVGEFKDDERNGQGIYTFPNGEKYVGEFKGGDYDGRGTLYTANGEVKYEGLWSKDQFVRNEKVSPGAGDTQSAQVNQITTNEVAGSQQGGSSSTSLWMHNGSLVRLDLQDGHLIIRYETPRSGLPVRSGTELLTASLTGNQLEGEAQIFSAKCGPTPYAVKGSLSSSKDKIELAGIAPRRNADCVSVEYFDDRLNFVFQSGENPFAEAKSLPVPVIEVMDTQSSEADGWSYAIKQDRISDVVYQFANKTFFDRGLAIKVDLKCDGRNLSSEVEIHFEGGRKVGEPQFMWSQVETFFLKYIGLRVRSRFPGEPMETIAPRQGEFGNVVTLFVIGADSGIFYAADRMKVNKPNIFNGIALFDIPTNSGNILVEIPFKNSAVEKVVRYCTASKAWIDLRASIRQDIKDQKEKTGAYALGTANNPDWSKGREYGSGACVTPPIFALQRIKGINYCK